MYKTWLLLHDPSHSYCFNPPTTQNFVQRKKSLKLIFLNNNFWPGYLLYPSHGRNSIQSPVMPKGGFANQMGVQNGERCSVE